MCDMTRLMFRQMKLLLEVYFSFLCKQLKGGLATTLGGQQTAPIRRTQRGGLGMMCSFDAKFYYFLAFAFCEGSSYCVMELWVTQLTSKGNPQFLSLSRYLTFLSPLSCGKVFKVHLNRVLSFYNHKKYRFTLIHNPQM